MQRLIDAWFDLGREPRSQRYEARTRDGWRLALYRYEPPRAQSPDAGAAVPRHVVQPLGHGRPRAHLAGALPGTARVRHVGGRAARRRAVDAPTWWNGKRYTWTFEDYVQHDAPAALRVVLRESGAAQVHWVGHSMGGMIAYALLMSPVHRQDRERRDARLADDERCRVTRCSTSACPIASCCALLPNRVPLGTLARLAAPLAPLLARLLGPQHCRARLVSGQCRRGTDADANAHRRRRSSRLAAARVRALVRHQGDERPLRHVRLHRTPRTHHGARS